MTTGPAGLTRRTALTLGGAAAVLPALRPFAWAEGRTGLHGLSVFGELKYPPDFKHFDYINPDAPKGGRINFQPPNWAYNQSTQTFNTLNTFVLKGDAPPRMGMVFASLMAGAADEADTMYGLAAETVAVSADGNTYTFTLRPGLTFHDGSSLTAADVAWSLGTLKEKGHPNISQPIREMVSAVARDPATVEVTLSGKQSRDTILTIAGLPILSAAYYADRDFEASTLDPPLGSGPYKVGQMAAGRFIEYERVADWWGRDLPVSVGQYNFDIIRIDFFRERQTAFEAFKKGEITFREEFTSITWAKEYTFPAVTEGKVKQTLFPAEAAPSMQGWFLNTRKAKFADPRTRQALDYAFDFEWTNKNLFFDAYARVSSYFQKSDFQAEGLPSPEEVALLEPFRADLPPEVFGEPYVPPQSDGSGSDRRLLRRASELLAEAGWQQRDGRVVDASGQALEVEFLIEAEVFVRVLTPYTENLRRIGVNATIRQVDPSQYQSRLSTYDFDVVGAAFSMSATPLDGTGQFFATRAAEASGTYNLAGIRQPAVDALLDKLPGVTNRAELVTILRALDRVLRAQHYWVSNWYSPNHRIAHWDVFAWPPEKPAYDFSPEATWWFDRERAASIGVAG